VHIIKTWFVIAITCMNATIWSADDNYYVRFVQNIGDVQGAIVPFAKNLLPFMQLLQGMAEDLPGTGTQTEPFPIVIDNVTQQQFAQILALIAHVQQYEQNFKQKSQDENLKLDQFLWTIYAPEHNHYALLSSLLAAGDFLGLPTRIIDSLRLCLAQPPYQKFLPKKSGPVDFQTAYRMLKRPTPITNVYAEQSVRQETFDDAMNAGLIAVNNVDNYEIKKSLRDLITDKLEAMLVDQNKPMFAGKLYAKDFNADDIMEACFMHTQTAGFAHLYTRDDNNVSQGSLVQFILEGMNTLGLKTYEPIGLPRYNLLSQVPNQQLLDHIPPHIWQNVAGGRAAILCPTINNNVTLKLSSNDHFLAIECYSTGPYTINDGHGSSILFNVITFYDVRQHKIITTIPAEIVFIDSFFGTDGIEKIICVVQHRWYNNRLKRTLGTSMVLQIDPNTGTITQLVDLNPRSYARMESLSLCMTKKNLLLLYENHLVIIDPLKERSTKIPFTFALQNIERIIAWDVGTAGLKIAIEPRLLTEYFFLDIDMTEKQERVSSSITQTKPEIFAHEMLIVQYDDIPGHIMPLYSADAFNIGEDLVNIMRTVNGMYVGYLSFSSSQQDNSLNLYKIAYNTLSASFKDLFMEFTEIPIEALYLMAELINKNSLSTMTALEQKMFDALPKEFQAMLRYFLEPKTSVEITSTGGTKRSRSPESPETARKRRKN